MTKPSGFTLIELLVTLTVAGILLAIAAPSFRTAFLNSARASKTNDFVEALTFARSQAVVLRRSVVMCRSNNPMTSVPACGSTNGWEDGWITFVDRNRNGVLDSLDADSNRDGLLSALDSDLSGNGAIDASDAILRRRERMTTAGETKLPIDRRFTLRGNGLPSIGTPVRVTFNGGGISANTGSVVACDSRGFEHSRVVVIASSGRIQSLESNDARVPAGAKTCLR